MLLPYAQQIIEHDDRAAVNGAHRLVYRHRFYRERFRFATSVSVRAEVVEARRVSQPLFPAMSDVDQDDVLHALDKVFAHDAR